MVEKAAAAEKAAAVEEAQVAAAVKEAAAVEAAALEGATAVTMEEDAVAQEAHATREAAVVEEAAAEEQAAEQAEKAVAVKKAEQAAAVEVAAVAEGATSAEEPGFAFDAGSPDALVEALPVHSLLLSETPSLCASRSSDSLAKSRMVLPSKAIGPVGTLVSVPEADAREAPIMGVGSGVRQLQAGQQQVIQLHGDAGASASTSLSVAMTRARASASPSLSVAMARAPCSLAPPMPLSAQFPVPQSSADEAIAEEEALSAAAADNKDSGQDIQQLREQRKADRREKKAKGRERKMAHDSTMFDDMEDNEAVWAATFEADGIFEDLEGSEAVWRVQWEAQREEGEALMREWEGRVQRGRWRAVVELAQEEVAARRLEEEEEEEEEWRLKAEAWWRQVECKARWERLKVRAQGELSQLKAEEEEATRSGRAQEVHTRLMTQAREAEMNRVNRAVQKAKARRERLLRTERRSQEAKWEAAAAAADYPTGSPGRRNIWSVRGETAAKLGRARRQERGVGWKPDARPAAMRRRRYRPQRMKRLQQKRGVMSTLACLSLLLALTAEGAAPVIAATAAPVQVMMAATAAAVVTAETWGGTVANGAKVAANSSAGTKGWGSMAQYSPAVQREGQLAAHEEAVRQRHDQQCKEFAAQRWQAATAAGGAGATGVAGGAVATSVKQEEEEPSDVEQKLLQHVNQAPEGNEEEGLEAAQIAAARRARFTATSAEVELLQGDTVKGEVAALLDSGAVLSCTSAQQVSGLRSTINRAQAAALCTADGSPMVGVQGQMQVRFRFKGSKRVFRMGMQVVDAKVPFILGMDFLKQEKAVLNYASGELCLPPVKGWPAMATKMQMGGMETVAAMVAAVGGGPTVERPEGAAEEPYLKENEGMPVYAVEDVIVQPGSYAHVDARLGGLVHQSDTLLLDSCVEVCHDREALNDAESWREQAADLRWHAARITGDDKKRKRMWLQSDVLEQQAAHLTRVGSGKAQFPALVNPWMDEGNPWIGVSTVLHNQGEEMLVVRKGSRVATAQRQSTWEAGPQLWEEEVQESQVAQVGVLEGKQFVNPQEQYLFTPGDWRCGKTGRELVTLVQEQKMEEFLEWHIEWYDKLVFGERLSQWQRTQLAMLLFAHQKIIAVNPKCPSVIKGVKHYIPFDTSQVIVPHKGRLRRLSPAEREAQDEETRVLLESGLVRPSTSPWGAGTVIVPKKDGGRRYAIDYRAVNKVTVKNCHPLPRCDDICDAVNGAFVPRQCPSNLPQSLPSLEEVKRRGVASAWDEKARHVTITSAFDVAAGFHGVEVAEEDRHKTAFSTWGYGLLEWNRMPFGLHGAPQTFQAGMESVLRGLVNIFCVVYVDDCACFSASFEAHVDHLGAIFERLDCANISIKISKCVWGTDTLPLLGHLIVAGQGTKPDPAKCLALSKAALPETTGQIKSFLGACGYYRKFIPNFAVLAEPLRKVEKLFSTKTAQVGDALRADRQAVRSYEALKAALVNAPILQAPDFTKPFIIISDASKRFIGGCLCQRSEDGIERPIAYTSRPLRGAELNYAITDLEGLAMVHCCALWRHFIVSSPTICITDHVSLTSLLTKQEHGSGRQARYALDLQEHDLQILHRAGESRKMALADFVSRTPLNPDMFEQKLMCNDTKVGTQQEGYKDSELWAVGSTEATIQAALEEAVVLPEDQLRYCLAPAHEGAKALISAVHADLFRRERAWGRCKPADPDESRTIQMLDTICAVTMQEAPVGVRSSTRAATAKSKAKVAVPTGGTIPTAAALRKGGVMAAEGPEGGGEEASSKEGTEEASSEEGTAESDEEEEEASCREEEASSEKGTAATKERSPTRQDLIDGLREVPRWQAMRQWKLEGRSAATKELQHFVQRYEANYECDEDGALWRIGWRDEEARLSPVKQLVVPPQWQEAVVRICHAGPEGAHRKTWTTYHKLRELLLVPQCSRSG